MPSQKRPKVDRKACIIEAQHAVSKAIDTGCRRLDIRNILSNEIVNEDLDEDYFKILKERDISDLYKFAIDQLATEREARQVKHRYVRPEVAHAPAAPRRVTSSRQHRDSAERSRQLDRNGATTPPREEGGRANQRTSGAESGAMPAFMENTNYADGRQPTYPDDNPSFDIALFHPVKKSFDLLTASRCEQKRSFISLEIINRNDFFKHVELREGQSIVLGWRFQNPADGNTKKSPKTRFWILKNDSIAHDVAIGTDYMNAREFEYDTEEEDEPAAEDDHSDGIREPSNEPDLRAGALQIRNLAFGAQQVVPLPNSAAEEDLFRRIGRMNAHAALALAESSAASSSSLWQQEQFAPAVMAGSSRTQSNVSSTKSSKSSHINAARRRR